MRIGSASGIQIAFLIFAVALLSVPLSGYVTGVLGTAAADSAVIGRTIPFVMAALIVLAFPALRERAFAEFARPVLSSRRIELAIVALAKVLVLLGAFGAMALWTWMSEGGYALEQRMAYSPAVETERAFSRQAIFVQLVLGAVIAPVIEELVFRGLLYRAWEKRWGWFPSAVLVSVIFGLYHPIFWSAFASSIVFVAVLRRVGSLWGPIIVHGFSNAMIWYPFAGQFAKPPSTAALGDVGAWGLQLSCLLFAAIALPFYLMLAAREDVRERLDDDREVQLAPTVWLER
jgi:membrane protease YdiL (CAAX protease family)